MGKNERIGFGLLMVWVVLVMGAFVSGYRSEGGGLDECISLSAVILKAGDGEYCFDRNGKTYCLRRDK